MADSTFEGRTRAGWLALKGKAAIGVPTPETPEKIEMALLHFAAEDGKARHETEERRFQTQLTETQRQGSRTRLISWIALVISAGALAVAILRSPSQSPQQIAPLPLPAHIVTSPTTNALPATTNTPAVPTP